MSIEKLDTLNPPFGVKDLSRWQAYVSDNGKENPIIQTIALAVQKMEAAMEIGQPLVDSISPSLSEALKQTENKDMSEFSYNCVLQGIVTHWNQGSQFGKIIRKAYARKNAFNGNGEPELN